MISLFSIVNAASGADSVVNSIMPKVVDNIVMPLLQLLFVVTMFYFVWGLFALFRDGDDSEAKKSAKNHILWGVIGIFIMISVYGIIRMVANTVGQPLPF